MLLTILVAIVVVLLAIILLSVNILFRKNGKFPDGHIGSNKAMKERGVKCAITQDREAQNQ
jgi:hypothetical protein